MKQPPLLTFNYGRDTCCAIVGWPEQTGRKMGPKTKFGNSALWRLAWGALLILVIVGSLLPANSPIMRAADALPVGDKLQHFAAYAALAFLPTLHERPSRLGILLSFAAVLGVLLEFGQLYSPGRYCDVYDMLANGLGIVIGFLLGLVLRFAVTR